MTTMESANSTPPAWMHQTLSIRSYELCEHTWYKLRAREPKISGKTKKLLYLHGGLSMCQTEIQHFSFCEDICLRTGAEIWMPNYPIGPGFDCTDALEMISGLYIMMLDTTPKEEIAFMGDFLGGSLALATAMFAKKLGFPQPNNLILISPWLEMNMALCPEEGEEYNKAKENDSLNLAEHLPILCKFWKGFLDEQDYRANPMMGDLHNLAPITIFSGTGDILHPGCRHFMKKAADTSAAVHLIERKTMPHAWLLSPDYKESEDRAYIAGLLSSG